MKRSVVVPCLRSAGAGAGLLLATTIEAAATTYPVQCVVEQGSIVLHNTTGRTIPNGTKIKVTICDSNGCVERIVTVNMYGYGDAKPGYPVWWSTPGEIVPRAGPGGSCTATWWTPDKPLRKSVEVPKYTRTKPPSPPQPGLLDAFPNDPMRNPSAVGTPKPSAPPSSPSGAPTLR